jgi:uncharacterized protein (TIGR02217 family)
MGILAGLYPEDIASGAVGMHGHFGVTIVEHQSGHETPNLDSTIARGRWNVARAIERTGQHEKARSHLYKARGRFHKFLFKDWTDCTCTRAGDDRGRLTGAGVTWQMGKVYGADEPAFEYVRPLHRIKPLSESIWVSGALQTRGSAYTIDNATGVVTSASSWVAGTIEMACEFYVLCRYDANGADPRLVHRRLGGELWIDWQNIDIVEVREDETVTP